MLDHRDVRVGRSRESSKVTSAGGLQEGLGDFRAVCERVNKNVNVANILLDRGSNLGHSPSLVASIALVGGNVFRDVFRGVEDGIHGVNVGEIHEVAVGELAGLVKLAAPEAGLEDVESRDPDTKGDFGTGLSQALGNGPTETLIIGNTSDESLLASQVNRQSRAIYARCSNGSSSAASQDHRLLSICEDGNLGDLDGSRSARNASYVALD